MTIASETANNAFAVTPSDSNDNIASALYIGTTGNVAVIPQGQANSVIFTAHPVGYLPVRVSKVLATGTTASNILGLF
jgi:hypothetical protein